MPHMTEIDREFWALIDATWPDPCTCPFCLAERDDDEGAS